MITVGDAETVGNTMWEVFVADCGGKQKLGEWKWMVFGQDLFYNNYAVACWSTRHQGCAIWSMLDQVNFRRNGNKKGCCTAWKEKSFVDIIQGNHTLNQDNKVVQLISQSFTKNEVRIFEAWNFHLHMQAQACNSYKKVFITPSLYALLSYNDFHTNGCLKMLYEILLLIIILWCLWLLNVKN